MGLPSVFKAIGQHIGSQNNLNLPLKYSGYFVSFHFFQHMIDYTTVNLLYSIYITTFTLLHFTSGF